MSLFRLKQFTIQQELSALKVGTDGMLLGAWVADRFHETPPSSILDVGTGTGIIALMLAQELQRSKIVGIEVDPLSAQEAQYNAQHSPFASRVEIIQGDFRACHFAQPFDLIVSNPPYFTPTHSNSDRRETIAKHAVELSPQHFFSNCQGTNVVIIVAQSATSLYQHAAEEAGLHLVEQVAIITKRGKAPQRHILRFAPDPVVSTKQSQLTILQGDSRHDYTEEYSRLLRPFLTIL